MMFVPVFTFTRCEYKIAMSVQDNSYNEWNAIQILKERHDLSDTTKQLHWHYPAQENIVRSNKIY